jgi:hypothetical protein
MKFMVMCSLDQGTVLDARVNKVMAGVGLLPVGSSRSEEGLPFGFENVFVGEFRAHDAALLESMLRAQLADVLPALESRPRLCVIPTQAAVQGKKRA